MGVPASVFHLCSPIVVLKNLQQNFHWLKYHGKCDSCVWWGAPLPTVPLPQRHGYYDEANNGTSCHFHCNFYFYFDFDFDFHFHFICCG